MKGRVPRNPNKTDDSKGLPEDFKAFAIIEDSRTGGRTLHHFGAVLFMVVSGLGGPNFFDCPSLMKRLIMRFEQKQHQCVAMSHCDWLKGTVCSFLKSSENHELHPFFYSTNGGAPDCAFAVRNFFHHTG
jgi:hypothetical protein